MKTKEEKNEIKKIKRKKIKINKRGNPNFQLCMRT
jgi:hypothetical protein